MPARNCSGHFHSGVVAVSSLKYWSVYVEGVGYVGTVSEHNEELARCAALHNYSREGRRENLKSPADPWYVIYEDDEFSVLEQK